MIIVRIFLKSYIATGVMLSKWKTAKTNAKEQMKKTSEVFRSAISPAHYEEPVNKQPR